MSHALTARTRRLIDLAADIARRCSAPSYGDLALLIAIVEEDGGIAARVLSNLGLQLQPLYKALSSRSKASAHNGGHAPSISHTASDIAQVVSAAVPVAVEMGRSEIGSEHLLLAMVRAPGS